MRAEIPRPLSSRRRPGPPLMHEKGTLRLSLLRTLAWPRASPDECSLSGQAFAVALAQTRFKAFNFVIVNAFLGIFHRFLVFRHRFSLGHAPHALILLLKFLVI